MGIELAYVATISGAIATVVVAYLKYKTKSENPREFLPPVVPPTTYTIDTMVKEFQDSIVLSKDKLSSIFRKLETLLRDHKDALELLEKLQDRSEATEKLMSDILHELHDSPSTEKVRELLKEYVQRS